MKTVHKGHLAPIRTAVRHNQATWKTAIVGKDVRNSEPFGTVGGNVKWCSHYGQKCEVEFPLDLSTLSS